MPELILFSFIALLIGGMLWSDRDSRRTGHACYPITYLAEILDAQRHRGKVVIIKGVSIGCSTSFSVESVDYLMEERPRNEN